MLILSLFPGIDLLGRAFENRGHCVVRGPDLLWGGDVRLFHPPASRFDGVIGGPPCQDFSSLRRAQPTGYGREMLDEFARCVTEAEPAWWLMENVARVPGVRIDGYFSQRLDVDQKWFSDSTRLRHFQFGSRSGRLLHIDRKPRQTTAGELPGAALAHDSRTIEELLRLQGLPPDFDLPGFTVEEKKRAIGNGVPLAMGRAIARAVTQAMARSVVTLQKTLDGGTEPAWVCACGCGHRVTGKKRYYDFSCRKRAQRRRETAKRLDGLPVGWDASERQMANDSRLTFVGRIAYQEALAHPDVKVELSAAELVELIGSLTLINSAALNMEQTYRIGALKRKLRSAADGIGPATKEFLELIRRYER